MLYKDFRNSHSNNRGNRPYKPFKEEGFANTEATPLSLEQLVRGEMYRLMRNIRTAWFEYSRKNDINLKGRINAFDEFMSIFAANNGENYDPADLAVYLHGQHATYTLLVDGPRDDDKSRLRLSQWVEPPEADPTNEREEMYYDLVRFPLDKVIVA